MSGVLSFLNFVSSKSTIVLYVFQGGRDVMDLSAMSSMSSPTLQAMSRMRNANVGTHEGRILKADV